MTNQPHASIMSESTPPPASRDETFRLLEAALGEFERTGSVRETRCNACDGIITVEQPADEVWKVHCPCGKFWGNLRGL
jgi:hypothetical protein